VRVRIFAGLRAIVGHRSSEEEVYVLPAVAGG
jgi:molybdopterin converting factor small subunit